MPTGLTSAGQAWTRTTRCAMLVSRRGRSRGPTTRLWRGAFTRTYNKVVEPAAQAGLGRRLVTVLSRWLLLGWWGRFRLWLLVTVALCRGWLGMWLWWAPWDWSVCCWRWPVRWPASGLLASLHGGGLWGCGSWGPSGLGLPGVAAAGVSCCLERTRPLVVWFARAGRLNHPGDGEGGVDRVFRLGSRAWPVASSPLQQPLAGTRGIPWA